MNGVLEPPGLAPHLVKRRRAFELANATLAAMGPIPGLADLAADWRSRNGESDDVGSHRHIKRAAPSTIAADDDAGRPLVVQEHIEAGDSSDDATARTISKMAEYVRFSAVDPAVMAAADYANAHFGMGNDSKLSKAWAVFWYVKHCVKFRLDEATMFRVGQQNSYDLLISPSVLIRMQDPAEDCDGFSMLTAALLTVLGIPAYFATVAASPADPSRWSHVFVLAAIDGGKILPLDTSHGPGPGWMVPQARVYRFQAWDMNGEASNVRPPGLDAMHGLYGMGDCDYEGDPTCYGGAPVTIPVPIVATPAVNPCGSGFLVDGVCQSSPGLLMSGGGSSSSGLDLTSFFNNLFGDAASVARVATGPTTTVRLPNGTVVSGVTPSQAGSLFGSTSLTSLAPMLGIAVVGILLFSFLGSRK